MMNALNKTYAALSLHRLRLQELRAAVFCYWVEPSPWGEAQVGTLKLEDGTSYLAWIGFSKTDDDARRRMHKISGGTKIFRDDTQKLNIFTNPDPSLKLAVMGTDFQFKVWQELRRIPFGQTTSYQALADFVGHTRASRAVGGAVGSNPLSIIIPCHRVLHKSGTKIGYEWGATMKQKILYGEQGS